MNTKNDTQTSKLLDRVSSLLKRTIRRLITIFERIIPPYDNRIEIDKKLMPKEVINEHAVIRHYAEVQLLISLLLIPLGIFLRLTLNSGFLFSISVLGIILFVTAYDIEEIYVTTHRVLIRRIGMVERIIRVPTDEEHSLEHLVSFNVGRAPPNIILLVIAGINYLVIFSDTLSDLVQLIVIIPASIVLIIGLRIQKRAVTLHFAGGLIILLGIRKGVPKRIVQAIQISMYEVDDSDNPSDTSTDDQGKTEDKLADQTSINDSEDQ